MPSMACEIEMKFPVPGLAAVRRALRRAGAEYLGTVLHSDSYFDTPTRTLLNGDVGLRIRRERPLRSVGPRGDRRPLVTFKGPARSGTPAKVRREIQTRLDDGGAFEEILEAVGLVRTVLVEKRRASYRLGRCRVELDELPLIGCFVEIEGAGAQAIKRIARRLDLAAEPCKDHYVNLLRAHCERVGGECSAVVFDECARCG